MAGLFGSRARHAHEWREVTLYISVCVYAHALYYGVWLPFPLEDKNKTFKTLSLRH